MRSSWFNSPFEGADSCTLKKHKSSLLNGSSACVFSCLFGMVASAVSSMVMFGVHMGVVSIVDDTMSVGFTAIGVMFLLLVPSGLVIVGFAGVGSMFLLLAPSGLVVITVGGSCCVLYPIVFSPLPCNLQPSLMAFSSMIFIALFRSLSSASFGCPFSVPYFHMDSATIVNTSGCVL